MSFSRQHHWRVLAIAAAIAVAVAGGGAWLTDLGPWYYALRKPAWQPPDWLFGPAWTVIFALTAAAAVVAWHRTFDARGRAALIAAFAANAVCNLLWSFLFFRLHRIDWALWEVAALWASVFACMIVAGSRTRAAAWLLVPYLLWVSFAAALNFKILQLNVDGTVRVVGGLDG